MGTWRNRTGPWPSAGLALVALLLLPACGDRPHPSAAAPAAAPPARPPPAQQARPPAVNPRSTIPLHATAPPTGAPAAATQPFLASAPPIVLTGLPAPELLRLLGEPAARIPTGPGERWTYRTSTCELEVFIFPDVAHGQPAVLDERLSAGPAGPDPEQACLRKLRDDHAL